MTADIRRARLAFLWVGVIIPLAVIVASAVVVAVWLPELPEPAAIHWSSDGVDGVAPGWMHLVLLVGVGGGMITAFALLVWFAHRGQAGPGRPAWSVTARFLGAVNLGLAGLMSVVALAAVGPQRGLARAMDAPNLGDVAAILGFALLIALTAIGWFVQPKVASVRSADASDAATALPTSASERVVWIGTTTVSRGGRVVLGGLVLLVVAFTVVLIATGAADVWAAATLIATAALLLVAFVVTLVFRVRIGPGGILVRSLAGWPKVEISAGEITSARDVTVTPFADFGGWGLRHGLDGRYGVVLRAGEALEVTRVDGRRFVVTIDDAETAAAVLATAVRQEG